MQTRVKKKPEAFKEITWLDSSHIKNLIVIKLKK